MTVSIPSSASVPERFDPLASNSRTWAQNDHPTTPVVAGWLQPLLIEMEAARADLAVQLDRRLETARSRGRV